MFNHQEEANNHIYNTMMEVLVEQKPGESIQDPQSDISRIVQHEVKILREDLLLDDHLISVISTIANIDLLSLRRSKPEDFGA